LISIVQEHLLLRNLGMEIIEISTLPWLMLGYMCMVKTDFKMSIRSALNPTCQGCWTSGMFQPW